MSRMKEALLLIGGVMVLVALFDLVNPFAVQGESQGGPKVTVVNTPENPVPTTVEGIQNVLVLNSEGEPLPVVIQASNDKTKTPFYINARLTPEKQKRVEIPDGKTAVVTDLVIQSRAPGDMPVDPSLFTRFELGTSDELDHGVSGYFVLRVVGNETINLHFQTGIPLNRFDFDENYIVLSNIISSSAPFCEVLVSGYYVDSL